MNISFDLDSTLIPNGKEFETEKRGGIAKLLGIEEIRKGTAELIAELKDQGNQVHIYTTSFRAKRKIRRTLNYYGITVDRIVNQTENQRELKSRNINSSKYPPAFGFDVHIDDSKGVGIESERHNFKVIIVDPSDVNWTEKITSRIEKTFESRILKRLLEQLWIQSKNGKEPIEHMWYPIQEAAKSEGVSRKVVNKHLWFLVNNDYVNFVSKKPLLFEFTEKGKQLKTDSEIENLIKNVG